MQVFASFGLHSGPRSRSATPLMNTSDMEAKVSTHPDLRHSTAFSLKPLMVAYMACTMAMMAFVALIGPIARLLHLPAWQAGAVVTVGGVLWMLLSRPWGTLSDRRGRFHAGLLGDVRGPDRVAACAACCRSGVRRAAAQPRRGECFFCGHTGNRAGAGGRSLPPRRSEPVRWRLWAQPMA